MTMTYAQAATAAVARTVFIADEMTGAIKQVMQLAQSGEEALYKGVERHWIRSLLIYLVDGAGQAQAKFELLVDWGVYGEQLRLGNVDIPKDERWQNGLSPEVGTMAGTMYQFMKRANLTPKWYVTYASGIDHAMIDRELGFRPAVAPPLTGQLQERRRTVTNAPELTSTLTLRTG